MLLLSLAAVISPFAGALTPQATVTFANGSTQTVVGPENTDQNAEYPWTLQGAQPSPRGDAVAVRFCWDIGKYSGCQVRLARAGRPMTVLSRSDVTRLLWTADGRYLIGAGANTVRLWNLSGGVRTATPSVTGAVPRAQSHSRIAGLKLSGPELCVQTADVWSGPNSARVGETRSAVRYALPSLRTIGVISAAAKEPGEVPCHLPVTEP